MSVRKENWTSPNKKIVAPLQKIIFDCKKKQKNNWTILPQKIFGHPQKKNLLQKKIKTKQKIKKNKLPQKNNSSPPSKKMLKSFKKNFEKKNRKNNCIVLYWCFYPHRLRDSVSLACRIFYHLRSAIR